MDYVTRCEPSDLPVGAYRGTLHLITGDDSSRQIATIDGADWSLRP